MFSDLGLKYVGPIDGHDIAGLELALGQAKGFRGPVLVHVLTDKGRGYAPAEQDDAELMHSPPAFDPATGQPVAATSTTWTQVFGRELVRIGTARPDVVAITAAMAGPTGLQPFGRAFGDRLFDVGIAEQHAVASAAGLALGGMHPVVAVYSTFLNRAFDQLLLDAAMHRLPVTMVLDRAGVTGEDGPSHHGMWDLSLAAMVPGLRVAAPRDAVSLAAELDEAIAVHDGPTLLRFPKGAVPGPVPAVRRIPAAGSDVPSRAGGEPTVFGAVDVLAEPGPERAADVLLVAVGAFGATGVEVAERLAAQGISVRVVDPRWVLPVPAALVELARGHRLVVTLEDGGRSGGVGAAVADALAETCVPVRILGLPQEFLEPAPRAELLRDLGLSAQAVARGITEHIARLAEAGGGTPNPVAADAG
jgi:1-deoxy-D-xylulose-5-phosphate synthase